MRVVQAYEQSQKSGQSIDCQETSVQLPIFSIGVKRDFIPIVFARQSYPGPQHVDSAVDEKQEKSFGAFSLLG